MKLSFSFKKITYDLNSLLGQGVSASVYRGNFENQEVAVKIIVKDRLAHNREETILKGLDHKNIIKLYDAEDQGLFR